MYLHLGQNEIVPDHRIIGIFDLDSASVGQKTKAVGERTVIICSITRHRRECPCWRVGPLCGVFGFSSVFFLLAAASPPDLWM